LNPLQGPMLPATNKTALFYAPGDVRIENIALTQPGPGEVTVRIGAALTCGTDRKTFKRGHPVIIKSIPSPFGHEMAGTIVAIGDGVKNFHNGQRVVVANSAPCGACFFCAKHKPNLCENLVFLNGAYAEYLKVPAVIVAKNLHPIPDSLSFAQAALSEPLACVMHAVSHTGIKQGDVVAIIGTGPMAFLFIEVLKSLGAKTIIVGRNPDRLKMAVAAGAQTVNSTTCDAVLAVKKLTQGFGADAVIEAVGTPETWEQAIALARKGGHVCLYGGCAKGTELKLDTFRVHYEEITVSGIFHHTPNIFAQAVALLAAGKIDTHNFLTHKRGLKDLVGIFEDQEKEQPLKFVIEP
jgi:L-iditol 2-dehydrogenase